MKNKAYIGDVSYLLVLGANITAMI